jgi:predicted extracellular nuclease
MSKEKTSKQLKGLELRIGQFNVLNLVKEDEKFYNNNIYTKEEVEAKVEWIAGMLKKMDAGLVGFEEIFHIEPLKKAAEGTAVQIHSYACSFWNLP